MFQQIAVSKNTSIYKYNLVENTKIKRMRHLPNFQPRNPVPLGLIAAMWWLWLCCVEAVESYNAVAATEESLHYLSTSHHHTHLPWLALPLGSLLQSPLLLFPYPQPPSAPLEGLLVKPPLMVQEIDDWEPKEQQLYTDCCCFALPHHLPQLMISDQNGWTAEIGP